MRHYLGLMRSVYLNLSQGSCTLAQSYSRPCTERAQLLQHREPQALLDSTRYSPLKVYIQSPKEQATVFCSVGFIQNLAKKKKTLYEMEKTKEFPIIIAQWLTTLYQGAIQSLCTRLGCRSPKADSLWLFININVININQ